MVCTGNTHKKAEIATIIGLNPSNERVPSFTQSRKLLIPADVGLEFDPEENGNSFYENSLIKARELHLLLTRNKLLESGDVIIADDSGICVDALDGRPGIFSARYAGAGKPADNAKLEASRRNELLLEEAAGSEKRSARFVCAMVLLFNMNRFYVAQEVLEGELVKDIHSSRGTGGFGYDPILYIPNMGRTVAELTEEEKNEVSHRAKAGKVISAILNCI